jgi:hypothetical protein
MRRSLAKFSESEAANHTPSVADFTTITSGFRFPVHTGIVAAVLSLMIARRKECSPPREALSGLKASA